MDFSIIVPVFNEEDSLRELVAGIKKALDGTKKTYEVIFVDDGSTDSSLNVLKHLAKQDKNLRIFSFRKNLGKSQALTLGFQRAIGEHIITMDADLQDEPSNIMPLFRKLTRGGYDLVTGWRKERKDGGFKILSSKLFNRIVIPTLFGFKLNDLNSGLKIYKSDVAKALKIYGGMHRFIPLLAAELGYRVAERETVHHARKYGTSKYKSTKILTDIPDLVTMYFITKYNRRPLHFFGKIGGVVFLIGLTLLLYLSYLHFIGEKIGDRPLLIFGALFVIAGIQIIFTGLIADLIVNLHSKDSEFPLKFES